jgi:hypothetical protein
MRGKSAIKQIQKITDIGQMIWEAGMEAEYELKVLKTDIAVNQKFLKQLVRRQTKNEKKEFNVRMHLPKNICRFCLTIWNQKVTSEMDCCGNPYSGKFKGGN